MVKQDMPKNDGKHSTPARLDEAQTHAYAGACYLHLKDWGRAPQQLRTTQRLQDVGYVCDLDRTSSRTAHLALTTLTVAGDRHGPLAACSSSWAAPSRSSSSAGATTPLYADKFMATAAKLAI